jgi:hypothetical protein
MQNTSMTEQANNSYTHEQSSVKDALMRIGKTLGGLTLGVATGYALAKGIEQIIPTDSGSDANFEGAAMIASGLVGGLIGSATK